MYKVHVGGDKWVKFATLDEAITFCEDIFQTKGIVLGIVPVVDENDSE